MTEGLEIHIKRELSKFSITDAAIAQMKKEYMPLKINGIEDKQGYSEVRAARMMVRGKRIEVEKTRKALKEDSLAFGKAVDAEAKREAEEKAEAERLSKLEAERQKALRPDKEKLVALAYEIEAITLPGGFASEEAKVIVAEVRKRVQAVAAYIRKGARDL